MQGSYLSRFLRSNIGLKILMAITGVVMFGYLVGHVSGNMLVFRGPKAINDYSAFLHHATGLLWGTRLVLLGSVAIHLWATVRFLALKKEARPVDYGMKVPHGTTWAARTMYWSGPVIALFIIYHLLHLTTGTAHPHFHEIKVGDEVVGVDVYRNLVVGFQSVPASLIYIVAMLAIALHLSHGLWSMLQTIGVNRPNWECALRCIAVVCAVIICGGFIAVPVSVLFGIVK
jgi:succinate dehydrogenase / fumarate reductase cytochrome b subunit